jgi:hypothetical protein
MQVSDYSEQITEALAAGARRAAQNRTAAHEYEVLANAAPSRREARALRAEAREARDQADTLAAFAARRRR